MNRSWTVCCGKSTSRSWRYTRATKTCPRRNRRGYVYPSWHSAVPEAEVSWVCSLDPQLNLGFPRFFFYLFQFLCWRRPPILWSGQAKWAWALILIRISAIQTFSRRSESTRDNSTPSRKWRRNTSTLQEKWKWNWNWWVGQSVGGRYFTLNLYRKVQLWDIVFLLWMVWVSPFQGLS